MTELPDKQRALHDLNNQLTVIIGFAELLLDGVEADDPRRDDLVEIMNAAKTAMSIAAEHFESA